MKNTLTRSEIAQAVHLEIGLSRNESSKLVEDVLEKMTECFGLFLIVIGTKFLYEYFNL